MSTTDETAETLSLPSLAIVTILGYLLYRYFFASPSASSTTSTSTARSGAQRFRFTPAQVDTVAGMFPQLSRRDIMWDLQNNGGSVQATTERVLGGRGLDVAPPSFQPLLPTPPNTTTPLRSSTATTSSSSSTSATSPDLITRYNLQDKVRVSDKGKQKEASESGEASEDTRGSASGSGTTGWANTKDARMGILQRRREEMILEARRKMMERDEGQRS